MFMNYPTIPEIDVVAAQKAETRQKNLTKPPKSLGRLEEISIQLAGMKANPLPTVDRKAVIVMAADHGVALEGVSAFPTEVTPQMVLNFLHGGAAVNVLARQAGADVTVVDIGVVSDFDPSLQGLVRRKIAREPVTWRTVRPCLERKLSRPLRWAWMCWRRLPKKVLTWWPREIWVSGIRHPHRRLRLL